MNIFLDRTIPPKREIIKEIKIPSTDVFDLANGFKVIVINAGTQDLVKVDVLFEAGTRYQPQALVANAAISMLTEGTATRTSKQIAEELDYFGSFVESSFSRDFASVTLYTIGKHYYRASDILSDILINPSYPQHELEIFCQKGKQMLEVELEKVSTLARQAFFSALFGANHPYGSFALPSHYDLLTRNMVVTFHRQYHTAQNGLIVLAGSLDDRKTQYLLDALESNTFLKLEDQDIPFPKYSTTKQRVFTYKKDAIQSSIRVGKVFPKRNHPDMTGLIVLNTLLGGYFGSRLMRNIREDKGYTYGISSYIMPMVEHSVWLVTTDVGNGFVEPTITEFFTEVERLQHEPVDSDELDLVRGYMIGQILRTFDGPLAISDAMASLFQYNNLDKEYINNLVKTINSITPEEIMTLANRYLGLDDMVVSVAGSSCPKGFN